MGSFFGAPVGIIVTVDRVFDRCGWGNVGMFLTTFALLCEEAGLSTCFQGFFGINHQVCRNVITEISDDHVVWCGIAVGYADEAAPINNWRTERAPVDDFHIHFRKAVIYVYKQLLLSTLELQGTCATK